VRPKTFGNRASDMAVFSARHELRLKKQLSIDHVIKLTTTRWYHTGRKDYRLACNRNEEISMEYC
jgi:hypothetical protein